MNYWALLFITIGGLSGLLLFVKSRLAIWTMIFMSMAVTGTMTYFAPKYGVMQWGNVVLSFLVLVRGLAEGLKQRGRPAGRFPLIFGLMVFFLGLSVISSIGNYHLKESFFASKNVFQFWGVPFALYFLVKDEKQMGSYMKSFVLIAALMPPLALYQFRYLGGLSHDAVTGTFGGTIEAGGPNAVLSIFVVSQLAVIFAWALRKFLSWKIALALSAWMLITITLTNAKGALVFLAIMFAFLLTKENFRLSRSTLMIVLSGVLMCGIVFAIFFQYSQRKRNWVKPPKSYSEFVDRAISHNLSLEENSKLNRATSMLLWWKYNVKMRTYLQVLFGHGVGASKYAGLSRGHIQKKFGNLKIGRTALTALLWDVGIVGLVTYVAIFGSGFFLAKRMKGDVRIPEKHRIFLLVAQLNCLFFVLSIPYKLSIINVQAFNFYAMFIIGYICFWQRRVRAIESGMVPEAV